MPDRERFNLFNGKPQLQTRNASRELFKPVLEDDVRWFARGMDKDDVRHLARIPRPSGHRHHRRNARPGRDEQVFPRRMAMEGKLPRRPMHLLYGQDRYRLPKLRAFVDFALEKWAR